MWLSPLPVKVLTITSKADDYAKDIVEKLRAVGIESECDIRNEKISYKVREHSHAKIPILLTVGDREIENESVTMRRLGSKDQKTMSLKEAIKGIEDEITARFST